MQGLLNHLTEIILLVFVIITFLQSGFDKLFDWEGNVNWLKEHFSKTIFRNIVPMLLSIILVVEMLAGIAALIGVFELPCTGEKTYSLIGAVLACITLLMLLFGQRIAKDYEGARTIVVYLIPTVLLVFLLR